MALSLACAVLLLLFLYGISILFEGTPEAIQLTDSALENFFLKDQSPSRIDLDLDLTTGRSIRATALISMETGPDSDVVYFLLNPALEVAEVQWDGQRVESVRRVGPLCRAALRSPSKGRGAGTLAVTYGGTLTRPESSSLFSTELIYLDPEDNFYPRVASSPIDVNIVAAFPPGFCPVASGEQRSIPARASIARFEWTLSRPVSAFSVAGCTATRSGNTVGELETSLFVLSKRSAVSGDTVRALYRFFQTHLAPLGPDSICFVVAPRDLSAHMRYDGAETVLVPEDVAISDLAYGFALCWIPERQSTPALFSREEMAMGWALYFISEQPELAKTYMTWLERIDLDHPAPPALPPSGLAGSLYKTRPSPERSAENGGYLLTVLRRFVGKETFDRVCLAALSAPSDTPVGAAFWNSRCSRTGGGEYDWFFSDWAGGRGRLDLAVESLTARPTGEKGGYQVNVVVKNRGNLALPEKVEIILITDSQWQRRRMVIPQGGVTWPVWIEEEVVGVLVDPDFEWPDADRSNNVAYLDPGPDLVMPSRENRFVAAAYRRAPGAEKVSLVVTETATKEKETFLLDAPVARLQWIGSERLLVETGRLSPNEAGRPAGTQHFLVEAGTGGIRFLGRNLRVSPSPSGLFLLLNERKRNRWQHRLLNLRDRMEHSLLSRIYFPLAFIEGKDLLRVQLPGSSARKVSLFSVDGERIYAGIEAAESELSDFEGYGKGIFFLGRGPEQTAFYYLPRPDADRSEIGELEPLFVFDAPEVRFRLDRNLGCIDFFERESSTGICRITRYDLDRLGRSERTELFRGAIDSLPELMSHNGWVKVEQGGRRIAFHYYDDESRTSIVAGSDRMRVLDLVGDAGRRELYYVREEPLRNLPHRWAGLASYMRYTFFRFVFDSGSSEKIEFSG